MAILLGSGRTAEVFEHREGRVLKLFYPDISDAAFTAELAIGVILNQVPGLAPYCDGAAEQAGRRGIIYRKVVGQPLGNCMLEQPFAIRSHARVLAAAQLAIFKAANLDLPSIKQRLAWSLTANPHLKPSEIASLELLLAKLPVGKSLLHGDLHPLNLLVAGDSCQAIDWTNATLGPPVADIARTLVILRYGRAPEASQSPIMQGISLAYTRLLARFYERQMRISLRYCRRELATWLVVVAAARLSELPANVEMQDIRTWLRRQIRKMA